MKGVVYVYITIMVVIAVFIFLYMVLGYPMVTLTGGMVIPMINSAPNSTVKTSALTTIDIVSTVWKYWPIVLILGFVVWGLIASQRQEPLYSNYGG